MSTVVKFVVPGECVPQPRHKVGNGRAYIAAEHAIHGFKQTVRAKCIEAMPRRAVHIGPLAVRFLFAMPRLPSYPKSLVHTWHAVKPDIDNLEKAALDAVKGVVYNDDSQIVEARALKVTVPSGGKAALYVAFLLCGEASDEVTDFFDHFNRC